MSITMTFKQRLGSVAALAAVTAAFPVYAGLTIIESNPAPKKVLTEVQVIEEGTRLREDNQRAAAEIERLRLDLAKVQADLKASETAARFAAINKNLDAMEARMTELGVYVMKINFGFNSVSVEPSEEANKIMLAAARRASRIRITGHADNTGSPESNRRIGLERARSARQYLTDHGVARSKVVISSRGASAPLASNGSEQGRAENRRVDISFRR